MHNIETDNLTKIFKKRPYVKQSSYQRLKNYLLGKRDIIVAVNKVSLKIRKGELFGLIGPNGAGKTTFVKLLSTLILPDGGTAKIDGHDLVNEQRAVRSKIGVVTGEYTRSLYWRLTGRQNLEFFAGLYNLKETDRVDHLLDFFNLTEWQNDLVMTYSSGMKHKLALARALLNDPPILLLDEPTKGLDPQSGFEIKAFVKGLKDKTILWTSHNLYEVDEICDRIAMINDGRILFEGKPNEFRKHLDYKKLEIVTDSPNARFFSPIENSSIVDDYTVEIVVKDINKSLKEVNKIIKERKIVIRSFRTLSPSLEEVFVKVLQSLHNYDTGGKRS